MCLFIQKDPKSEQTMQNDTQPCAHVDFTKPATTEPLRSIRGFHDLADKDLAEVSAQLQWHRIEPGESLMFQRDHAHAIYLICQGTVKTLMYTENGKEITYEEHHAGSFVGEVAAIDGKPGLTQAVAVTETVVAVMNFNIFSNLMMQNPSLSVEVTRKMCESIRLLCERVYELSAMTVARRIDHELYRIAANYSRDGVSADIEVAPKHIEIASRVNTQRETVTKHISKLRKSGVIQTQGGGMYIPNFSVLRNSTYAS